MIATKAERKTFKQSVTAEDSRRSRDETTVRLRKTKKEEHLARRRQMIQHPLQTSSSFENPKSDTITIGGPSSRAEPSELIVKFITWQSNPSAVSVAELHETTKAFRRLLAIEKNPPVREVIESGAVPFLVQFLVMTDHDDLVFEAAWALTNIASTEFAKAVATPEAVASLGKLLVHLNPNIREQAAWCLGNIAGDCIQFRDGLLACPDVLSGMTANLQYPSNSSMLKNVSWAVSNLCRGKPAPELNQIKPFIISLASVLKDLDKEGNNEEGIRADAMWAVSYIVDGIEEAIQLFLDAGILGPLMNSLIHSQSDRATLIPTIRALGNIVAGTDHHAAQVLRSGYLEQILPLCSHESRMVKKDVYWTISNFAAGTAEQIAAVMNTPGLVDEVIRAAELATWEVRKEAVWVICNLVTSGTSSDLRVLTELGVMHALCGILKSKDDSKMLLIVMEAVEKLLEMDDAVIRPLAIQMDEEGGVTAVEDLQEHENEYVYKQAVNIIDRFFSNPDDDEEDQNLAPMAGESSFSFGLPSKQLFPGGVSSPSSYPQSPMCFNFGGSTVSNISQV